MFKTVQDLFQMLKAIGWPGTYLIARAGLEEQAGAFCGLHDMSMQVKGLFACHFLPSSAELPARQSSAHDMLTLAYC